MEMIVKAVQIIVALGIYNVWFLRLGKSTNWRGGNARSMKEEFAVYGLPSWSLGVIGFLKVLFATGLVVGVWVPGLTKPSAIGLGLLMAGAVTMHFKVKDPMLKSLPAFTLLVLCIFLAVL
jgi:hypothetical protein